MILFFPSDFSKCFNFIEVKIILQWTRVHLHQPVLFTYLFSTALQLSIYKHLKSQQTVCGQHCE